MGEKPSSEETKPKRRSECCSVAITYGYKDFSATGFTESTLNAPYQHRSTEKNKGTAVVPLNTLKRRFVEKNCLLVNHYAGSVPTL